MDSLTATACQQLDTSLAIDGSEMDVLVIDSGERLGEGRLNSDGMAMDVMMATQQ